MKDTLRDLAIFAVIFIGILITAHVFGAEQKSVDIIYFSMPGCSGCVQMAPVIKELEEEGFNVKHAKRIDWVKYRVSRVPTTIVYHNGIEVKRFLGYTPKAIVKSYLPKTINIDSLAKRVEIIVAGYDDRSFTISVISRELKKDGIKLVHLKKSQYPKYKITTTPTIIFFENGTEKYRLICKS